MSKEIEITELKRRKALFATVKTLQKQIQEDIAGRPVAAMFNMPALKQWLEDDEVALCIDKEEELVEDRRKELRRNLPATRRCGIVDRRDATSRRANDPVFISPSPWKTI